MDGDDADEEMFIELIIANERVQGWLADTRPGLLIEWPSDLSLCRLGRWNQKWEKECSDGVVGCFIKQPGLCRGGET